MKTIWCTLFVFTLCAAAEISAADGLRVPLGANGPGQPERFVTIPGAPLPPVPSGSIKDAIAIYEPMVALSRLGGDTSSTANGLAYLATLHASIGHYEKADRLFDEAQKILQKYPAGEILAGLHNSRGLVLLQEEKYVRAMQSFRAAVAILDPKRQEYREPRVAALGNLAAAYNLLGDAENAECVYLDALEVVRRVGSEERPQGQILRSNLAMLYGTIGDYEASRTLLEKLLSEGNLSRKLRFAALNELGSALAGLQRFPEAERRLQAALDMTAANSPEHAFALMNLASTYGWSNDYGRAESLAQEALRLTRKLYGEHSRMAAAVMVTLAASAISRDELGKADELLERALPVLSKERGDEEVYVFAMRGLAMVAQLRGQKKRALELSRRALALSKTELSPILAFGTESQRLAFRSHASPYDQLANLGDPVLLADAVLAMKGVVLDSLLQERALVRRSQSPADLEQLQSISALKLEIQQNIGRGKNIVALARLLKTNENTLTRRLAPQLRTKQEEVSVAAVQRKLGKTQAVIEIILYQRYEKGAKLVPSYGGIVIPQEGMPSWVPLGAAEEIDRQIRRLVDMFNAAGPSRGVKTPARYDDAGPILRRLNDVLWEPLSAKLPKGTASVLLSPDGATAFLPWAALVNEQGAFLAERQAVTQFGSAHDLLHDAAPAHTKTLLAFGRPSPELLTLLDEVKDLVRTAEQKGWRAISFIGAKATEEALFDHRRPGILHLATHGGLLEGSAVTRLSRNPMYRGYVLLEGGEQTLQRWAKGSADASSRDGVVTAEEASALDLSGTWLTVLSACETGAGDARTGEGVLGLRRGFTMAGTAHLLFTLWRVKDAPTTQFMDAFYKNLFQSGDPAAAFQQTQKAELLRWKRKTGNIGTAAYRAGGFVLTR